MARVKGGVTSRARHKKVLKAASGHRGARHRLIARAHTSVMRAGQNAYNDRRLKKRTMRALWIARINAAAREIGTKYSQVIGWLSKANMELDRRVLADLALHVPGDFKKVVEAARKAAGA